MFRGWVVALSVALLVHVGCGSSGGGTTAAPVESVQGYVISSFRYLYPEDVAGGCPGGFNRGPVERRLDGEEPLPDDCNDPEAHSDPEFEAFAGPAPIDGFDLDGVDSHSAEPGATCAHDDFADPSGAGGVDYQLWRALGCVRGFQEGEIADIVVAGAVREGSMTILLEMFDVDGEGDDEDVGLQIFASTEAPPTGPDGAVLPFATLSVHEDAAYHSEVGRGPLRDGQLTAGPMDLRVRLNIQIVAGDLTFQDAVVRVEKHADGTISGAIFGYQAIDEVYEIFGRQAGRAGSEALSYTCSGLWAALQSQADAGFDPVTGECSLISVAYQFEAVPAFVAR